VAEMVPVFVAEIVPVEVAEIVPVEVAEIVPPFANAVVAQRVTIKSAVKELSFSCFIFTPGG